MMSARRKGEEQKTEEENKMRRQVEVESQPEAELATLGRGKGFYKKCRSRKTSHRLFIAKLSATRE